MIRIKAKKEKLKKLGKAHIWPSVLFLLIFTALGFIDVLISTMSFLWYFQYDKINAAYETASHISSMLYAAKDEAAVNDTLKYLEEYPGLSEAVYILDEKGGEVSGFGKKTCNMAHPIQLHTKKDYQVFTDTEYETNPFIEDYDLDIEKFLENNNVMKNIENAGELLLNQSDVVYEYCIWFGSPLPDGRTVMVRSRISLVRRDVAFAVITMRFTAFIMLLPGIFLFINLMLNISNQRRMTKLIYTDPVTSGNNRTYFEHNAGRELSSKWNADKLFAVTEIAVMKYSGYCTYHGAGAGEELLENVRRELGNYVFKKEFAAHYEKSGFVLFLRCTDKVQCCERVEKIINELTEKFNRCGVAFHAGIYFSEPEKTKDGKRTLSDRITNAADCFNLAHEAALTLTDSSSSGSAVFDETLLNEKLWEHKVEEKMKEALDKEEFKVYLQPKYDPVTEKLAGAEALVRWINEEDGFIPPGRFIPIFEKNGFIIKLDDYMISHTAKLQSEWLAQGKSIVPVSVNVSRAHFADPNLAQHICELVDKYGVPHKYIEIELTESAFFDDKAALLKTLGELGELGFEISMDDFGAGYSSLNSLKDLPLDVLKLDAEFFRGESGGERGEIVISEAISLAKKLNMRVVAEGVEKKDQVDFLAGKGCDMIQGYYFAKPMPADEYAERL